MLLRLFAPVLLTLVFVKCQDYNCPEQGEVYASCTAELLYMIDDSADLSNSQIQAIFNFTRFNIIPHTEWSSQHSSSNIYVTFYTYGTGDYDYYAPTSDFFGACDNLGYLEYQYFHNLGKTASLKEALEDVNSHFGSYLTNIVIFSGDKDISDIYNAGLYSIDYMAKIQFTIIALDGAPFDWTIFPAVIYHVNDLNNPPDNLDWCVINSACGLDPRCSINETPGGSTVAPSSRAARLTTTPATVPPSTAKPTISSTSSTQTTTTTRLPTTSTPGSSQSNLQCQCDTMSAWLDIMFVIDASASTGEMGLDEMWGMAGTMLDLFNIQMTGYMGSNYTSRAGIITYGNSANVLYPLGSLNNGLIDNLFDLPFNNDQMTNLEAGLQAAVEQFNGPNHRSNTREVIIVMAAAFNSIGTNAPNKTATTFKEDGGIIMVFNYVPENGIESPMLASIASPGYFFSTTLNSHYTDMALGLCDANCFCMDSLHPYGLSNPRQYPTKGCYVGIPAENNYARAVNSCKAHYYGGTVAADEDSMKTIFLKTLFPSNNAFYIGLTYDTFDRRWEWADGTTPGYYQPWAGVRSSLQGYGCPAPGQVNSYCDSAVLYLIDVSIDLSQYQIKSEFDFIRNKIFPHVDWDRSFFMIMCTYHPEPEWDFPPQNTLSALCGQLNDLETDYDSHASLEDYTLLDALENVDEVYGQDLTNIVIFSGNMDKTDISNSAKYINTNMNDIKFTVVALNRSLISEANFPATVYHIYDLNNPPDTLARCVIDSGCDSFDPNCHFNETGPGSPTAPPPSTRQTTTTTTTTTTKLTTRSTTGMRSTTTSAPITTTSPTSSSNLQCQCDTMSAWLDMIFVIDASASTGKSGLDEMWGIAGTMLDLFNVQKTSYTVSNYTSRVGIITYGNTANVLYSLGSLDNDAIDNLFDLPFNNDPMANLEAGIQAAVREFNGPNHRTNARKVIIIMAAAYNAEGANAPNKTASSFKEDNGIIMVFNYVPEGDIESPMLSSLASPGYFFSTTLSSHYTDMALGLCDANCFCGNNQHSYGLSSPRQYPTQGCFVPITADSNYARATNNCKINYYNGIVATDKDSAKTTFLKSLFPSNNAFYIGLTYDSFDRAWEWPDGTSPGSYQPWVSGKNPDGGSQQCVYINSNSQWQPTDCRNGFAYVCEILPCDSVHYCG